MLDSNTELIKITKDSITINSGFFMEGKKDTINKEIIVNDNVTNYEMLNNKIILKYNKRKSKTYIKSKSDNPIADTLLRIKDNYLSSITELWINSKTDMRMLLILNNDGSVLMGGILKSVSFPYDVDKEHITFMENIGDLYEENILKLIPDGLTETYIYNKLQ